MTVAQLDRQPPVRHRLLERFQLDVHAWHEEQRFATKSAGSRAAAISPG